MKFFSRQQGLGGALGPIIVVGMMLLLIGIAVYSILYRSHASSADLIAADLAQLSSIFERIDRECKIVGFDAPKNPINFLNVGSFSGSEIGPMNVAYPTHWKGPYLTDHPTIQGKEYQIISTNQGYFIIPGDGVVLPNGNIVGKDIIIDEKSDLQAMMANPQMLRYQDKALGVSLQLGTTSWQKVLLMQDLSDAE